MGVWFGLVSGDFFGRWEGVNASVVCTLQYVSVLNAGSYTV